MKKSIGAIALVLAVFSMLYLSNTALAGKAAIGVSPSTQTVDVSNLDVANFTITSMDGASSVKIVARNSASLDAFQTVTSLEGLTSEANYTRTASELQSQFGYVTIEWKAVNEDNPSHQSSLCSKLIQP